MYKGNVHHNHQSFDSCVIYFDQKASCWVAHGLETDQLGTGPSVLDACVNYLRNIKALLAICKKDSSASVFRNAPPFVYNLKERATAIPKEITDIASKKVSGQWPDELLCDIQSPNYSVYGFELDDCQIEQKC